MQDSLGICLGASTISMVALRRNGGKVETLWTRNRCHEGSPRHTLREMVEQLDNDYKLVAATGRKFRNYLNLSTISEPEAVELACRWLLPEDHLYRVIISAGGETFMVYHLDEDNRVQNIHTGNKCASGTGEFFLQQLGRMSISLEEVGRMELPEKVCQVSGRCSVFCKSDCTHALNKGIPKEKVVGGLSRMMASKGLELLKKFPKEHVMLIGGCTRNQPMVHYLSREIDDLFIPEEACYFEAYGAALWALDRFAEGLAEERLKALPKPDHIFVDRKLNLSFLEPLSRFGQQVDFKNHPRGRAAAGDRTILGLDVGSTTTKGVIMRRQDKAILAADYLRTSGDPVGASRLVYESLAGQMTVPVIIEGLGVTGSGRQISGLHAMTEGVINEIIAHATAAVHFDPEVDTIFEIGGQDAKYTYITNRVPSDYAMNEACSAGTGSFLEEAAKESLGLEVTEIGRTAYEGTCPPNFNDQCAAFIGSDIKSAAQEGIPVEDIVAGLVYSICMNYINRVKGNRPVGEKVFVQGGVCYNEAVPAAMAALTGKKMVVPPDPGLMGAFGVALEVEHRLEQGLLEKQEFDLQELIRRDVKYREPFICGGAKDCDRGCEISRIEIAGKIYPFGGICNRYDNLIHKRRIDSTGLNLVTWRERRVFRDLSPEDPEDKRPTVGMNRSFLVNTYFPFYNRFFAELGYRLVLPEDVDPEGVEQRNAPFCFPVELAHGYAASLLARDPDFYFLPHLQGIPSADKYSDISCTCVFLQGEPYYLPVAFSSLPSYRIISPCLNFTKGIATNRGAFQEVAGRLGVDRGKVNKALETAAAEQQLLQADFEKMGHEALTRIRQDPEKIALILFGRSYNSFVQVANKGIPAKFASRGYQIIPLDMVPFESEPLPADSHMYWGMGQMILKGASYVKKDPQLFAVYITNFSCGPDSFLVGYFRDKMASKPSLTLELDSHTADAGIETRIEAFLDIVCYYRKLQEKRRPARTRTDAFCRAEMETSKGRIGIRTSEGEWLPLHDDRVKVVLPAMGYFGTPLLAKTFARKGIRAEALPPADEAVLKKGRGNSSCKECLPLQTTIGSMLNYLYSRPEGEVTAYFMASANGPCRFGQYHVFSKRTIKKHRIANAAVFSLSSANGYGGLGNRFTLAAWRAVLIGDIFDEIRATVLAGARDREQGLAILDQEYNRILEAVDRDWPELARQLEESAGNLASIELSTPFHKIPKVSLIGEIYVRHDPISLQNLVERMADKGFILRTAPNSEWLKYTDWLVRSKIEGRPDLGWWTKYWVKKYFDRRIRKLLAPSALFFHEEKMEVEPVIEAASPLISPRLTGEAILTVGAALHEILHPSCGVISIGPFGCMPTRLAESILNQKFTTAEKRRLLGSRIPGKWQNILNRDRKFPFLAIETDGNPFPQIIEARLEAFCLQAQRLNNWMNDE
ncbi:MAG: acyl-CoA dehydratase activase [Thermodesulfobacteriota bacterium]